MRYLREAVARIAGMFNKNRSDADLRAELAAHVEMEAAELMRRGMAPQEAMRQALITAGGLTVATEAVRDQRGLPWLESVVSDVRYALRSLAHGKAFAAVVIITLALGIGANTAIFSVVRGVLLKPLPHREGHRLVYLRQSATGNPDVNFSVPETRDLRSGAPSFGGIAEWSQWNATLRGSTARRVTLGLVTGNYFEVMGLSPVVGRVTSSGDDGPGVPVVAVLSHDFWMRQYGGDSSIVGKMVQLDETQVAVIGVLQPAPFFPSQVDIITNMVMSPHHLSAFMVEDRQHRMTQLVARLAPGATLDQATTEVTAVQQRLASEFKGVYDPAQRYRMDVVPFRRALGERAELTVWLLMAAAMFVMIISAANVANLTLMRGVRREHELVVRAALGAGVARLRRLLLAENLMLTLAGAALGVLIALGGVDFLVALASRYSPRAGEIRLDRSVLGFTLGLAVAIALLMSYVAYLPKEGAFAAWISAGARRMSGGMRKQRLQRTLVVAQVAVSVILLAGAGLLTRTMIRLSDVSTGLRTEEVLTMPVPLVNPARISLEADAATKTTLERMRVAVAALPGVVQAGVGSAMPLRTAIDFQVKAEGKTPEVGAPAPTADLRQADPDYFGAAGIPLVRGRTFELADGRGAPKVVIVNQVLADRFFPGEDAVGKRIALTGPVLRFTPFTDEWRTIVGVVGTTQDGGFDAKPTPALYMPFAQEFVVGGGLVIRADSNVARLAAVATRVVREMAPTVPINDALSIAQYRARSVAPRRLNALLISGFGALALTIAAVGIAGVLAFSVSARTTEIGIRMSLGAGQHQVQKMILREGGSLVLVGLVLGVIGAAALSGVMRGFLFGVEPYDPVTFVAVAIVMTVIGVVACWIPALRASRIDPAITMRT